MPNLEPDPSTAQKTMKSKSPLHSFLLAAGCSLLAMSSAHAQTWNGSVDGLWSSAGNWDVPPVDGNSLTFSGTANQTNTNDAGITRIGTLTLSNAGWDIDLGLLRLSTPVGMGAIVATGDSTLRGNFAIGDGSPKTITLNGAAGTTTLTIADQLTLYRANQNMVLQVNGAGNTLLVGSLAMGAGSGNKTIGGTANVTVSGAVTENINGSFVKNGTGTLTFNGTYTSNSPTSVNDGIFTLNGSITKSQMTISGGAVNGSGILNFNVSGATIDQITMTGGALDASGLKVNINGTLTETEYLLVDATSIPGAITGTFATLTGAPGYVLDYATPDQIKLVQTGGPADPYESWATGGELFEEDENGDGVPNGLAWMLGADNPNANALDLLPTVSETGGNLVLTFTCLNDASNGNAVLSLQHSGDLGINDAWATVAVPDTTPGGPVSGVTFSISVNGLDADFNDVVATISSSEAVANKLFARLLAENP